jgi:hypothetical protein
LTPSLRQDIHNLQSQAKRFSQYAPIEVSEDGLLTPEDHLPSPANILPMNCASQTPPEDERSSPSDSSTTYGGQLVRDFEDVLLGLSLYTTALLDLLPSISHSLAIVASTNTKDVNQFTVNIIDKYGEDNSPLKQRLGDANMKRYNRLLRMAHESAEINTSKQDGVFVPPSKTDSRFYSGTKSLATMTVDPWLDLSNRSRSGESSRLFYSISTSTTKANVSTGETTIPAMPEEVKSGVPFTCEICWQLQKDIKSRTDWK